MASQNLVFDPEGDVKFTFEEEAVENGDEHRGAGKADEKDSNPRGKRKRSNSTTPEAQMITMLVSSRHLSLASNVFKAMLRQNFQEGNELSLNGTVTINLPEDNPTAFEILMNIIHAKNRSIPKKVTLQMLTELAILVDKYRMHESTGFLADMWIAELEDDIPHKMCEDLMLWMAITYVFRHEEHFEDVTATARYYTVGKRFRFKQGARFSESLPIPEKVIGAEQSLFGLFPLNKKLITFAEEIDRLRQHDICLALSKIGALIKRLQSPQPKLCPASIFICESSLLGSLLRSALSLKLWPLPEKPYEQLSFHDVSSSIKKLEILSYCQANHKGQDGHFLMDGIQREVENIRSRQFGVEIDFTGP
ncbi:hypothetical protein HYFRA_00011459 [Hymenoscyphus fraxineus]|uniref:BTB domain-containing protein n=1 Tax=Hymenoscyphus fraxineus TaxID=746836 RepID=A0A9N9L3H3_9HELO|nr:hypothetical protein HYFRA_00011459 [Hymenoscyphus fraxineus]